MTTTTNDGGENVSAARKTTLGELGARLPLGRNGRVDLRAKPWRLKEEKMLADLAEKTRKKSAAEQIAARVGEMFEVIGPCDLAGMATREDRTAAVCGLAMGDVFYAYVFMRIVAVGSKLGMKSSCAMCDHITPITVDLNDLDVIAYDDDSKARVKVKLRDPVKLGGVMAEEVTLAPSTWNAMRHGAKPGSLSVSGATSETVRSSIVEVNGVAVPVTETEVDELTKFDLQAMNDAFEESMPGPNFIIETKCPHCDHVGMTSVDWTSPGFFKASSRS